MVTRCCCTPLKQKGPGRSPGLLRYGEGALGEVVADVAEDVLNLTAEEDHGDDDGNGDDSDDEGILDQALAVVLAEEALNAHGDPPFSEQRRRRSYTRELARDRARRQGAEERDPDRAA